MWRGASWWWSYLFTVSYAVRSDHSRRGVKKNNSSSVKIRFIYLSVRRSKLFLSPIPFDYKTCKDMDKECQMLLQYSGNKSTKTAFLVAERDIRKLTLSIQVNVMRQNPAPTVPNTLTFENTEDKKMYTICLLDFNPTIDSCFHAQFHLAMKRILEQV